MTWKRSFSRSELRDQQVPFGNRLLQRCVLDGIGLIDRSADHSNDRTASLHGFSQCLSVDATGETRHNDDASAGQFLRQPSRSRGSFGGHLASADDCDAFSGKQRRITSAPDRPVRLSKRAIEFLFGGLVGSHGSATQNQCPECCLYNCCWRRIALASNGRA